jgi:hypothetical protein
VEDICNRSHTETLQNKIIELIIGVKDMLHSLNWLSVKQRVYFNTFVLIFKMKNGMLPDYLSDKLHTHHNTRSDNSIELPNYTKKNTENSVMYKGVKMCNELTEENKNAKNLMIFKRLCTQYIKENF